MQPYDRPGQRPAATLLDLKPRRDGTYRSASAGESTLGVTGAFHELLELFGHSVLIRLGMAVRFRSLPGNACSLLVGTYTLGAACSR